MNVMTIDEVRAKLIDQAENKLKLIRKLDAGPVEDTTEVLRRASYCGLLSEETYDLWKRAKARHKRCGRLILETPTNHAGIYEYFCQCGERIKLFCDPVNTAKGWTGSEYMSDEVSEIEPSCYLDPHEAENLNKEELLSELGINIKNLRAELLKRIEERRRQEEEAVLRQLKEELEAIDQIEKDPEARVLFLACCDVDRANELKEIAKEILYQIDPWEGGFGSLLNIAGGINDFVQLIKEKK